MQELGGIWPDQEIVARVLASIRQAGLSPEAAAEETGISGSTIRRWDESEVAGEPVERIATNTRIAALKYLQKSSRGGEVAGGGRANIAFGASGRGTVGPPTTSPRADGYIEGMQEAAAAMRIVILGIEKRVEEVRRAAAGGSDDDSGARLSDRGSEDQQDASGEEPKDESA